MTDTSDYRVCVTTHHRYNCGNSAGEWLDLINYTDSNEFEDACRELFKETEDDPELLILDWEGVPNILIDSAAGRVNPAFWEYYLPLIEDSGYPAEAVDAYLDNFCQQDIDAGLRRFSDHYQGRYDSAEAFAEEFFHDCYDIPEHLEYYIDWERVARDLQQDYSFVESGRYVYVFRD